MTITSKAVAKVAAVATGLAMATSMLSFAPMVHAQAACSVGTTDLTIGSSGAAVTCLQQVLIGAGYAIPAGATGYFGTQTQAAVAAWQAAVGISPAAGYFGPISRAHWTGSVSVGTGTSTVPGCVAGAMFSSTTGAACTSVSTVPGCTPGAMFSSTTGQSCATTGTGSTTGLTGSGRLTNVDSAGAIESDLKEGDSSTPVIAVSADAKDGDVSIQRVDVDLDIEANNPGPADSSASITKYLSTVSIYLDGKKLADMDASAGDKTGRDWEYRFSGLNGVIADGQTGQITVQVTPVDSIGANEDGETIDASIPDDGIRAVGGDGISDTYGLGLDDEEFTVSSATTGQLTLSEGNSNPDDSVVKVDADNTTTDITLLSTGLKAKKQDITVNDFPVQICATNNGNDVTDLIQSVSLLKGSTTLKTKSITGSATCSNIVFDNINNDISQDSTATYTVQATFKKQDGNYDVGSTLVASTTGTLAWDVEDANGDTVTPTGSTVGGTLTLQTTGITVTMGTPSIQYVNGSSGPVADRATFKIPFTVQSGDDDLWIASSTALKRSVSSMVGKTTWATTTDSTTASTDIGVATITASGSTSNDDSDGNFKINGGGSSRTFTLSVTLTATASGSTGVRLTGIGYGTTANVIDQVYDTGLSDFKTDLQFMSAN